MIEFQIQPPDQQGWLALHLTETAPGGQSFPLFSVNGESRHLLDAFIREFTRADRDRTRLLWELKCRNYFHQPGDPYTFRPVYPMLTSKDKQQRCKHEVKTIERMLNEACEHVGITGH